MPHAPLASLPPDEILEAAGEAGMEVAVGGSGGGGGPRPAPLAVGPSVAVVKGLPAAALEGKCKIMSSHISSSTRICVIANCGCSQRKCIKEHARDLDIQTILRQSPDGMYVACLAWLTHA